MSSICASLEDLIEQITVQVKCFFEVLKIILGFVDARPNRQSNKLGISE